MDHFINDQVNHTSSYFFPSSSNILLPLLSGSSQAFKFLPDFAHRISMDQFTPVYMKSADSVRRLFGDGHPFELSSSATILLGLLAVSVTYLIIVRMLRFGRIERLQRHYNYRTRAALAHMTDHEAWEIQRAMSQLEFPFTFEKSLQFALFRVCFVFYFFFPLLHPSTEISISN